VAGPVVVVVLVVVAPRGDGDEFCFKHSYTFKVRT
jgi:hypothetical protein